MAGEDHHHLGAAAAASPHPQMVHLHRSRSRGAVVVRGAASSPRRSSTSRRESLEGGGRSRSQHHAHSLSITRSVAAAAVPYSSRSSSSSASSDEEFWAHRNSPRRSRSIDSGRGSSVNIQHRSSSGSGAGAGSSSSSSSGSPHTSLRLAFRSSSNSRGGGSGRRERADGVGDQGLRGGGGRGGGDNNHGRRSSLFLSLVDSEGSARSSRSIEHCLEAPEPALGAMLPSVEVARRRRVRLAETYEGGGGFGGGHQHEAGQSSRSSRSGVTVAHHHHYHHHHHHHHVHHQPNRHPSRPGTPRPGSLVRRMQDILQEHRARSPFQQISNSSSSSRADRTNAAEVNSTPHSSSHHRSSRNHGEGESRVPSLSSLWRRQASDTTSNLRGAALEARNRLDERLRAAAHANHSRRSGQAVQSSFDMNLLFSDDEEDNFWSDDDGGETSLNEWLAVWAPTAWVPSSVEERLNRAESSGSSRASSSSRNQAFKRRPSEGLSKAAIIALPRQVVGSARTQGGGSNGRSKMEQEDCPVCLEGFLQGQSLMTLPCDHRFHPECLTPWLTNHGQCPYCRADIVKDIDTSAEQKISSQLMGGSDEELLSWVEAIERGMDRLSYS